MTTTQQIEDIFRRLMEQANCGAQRTPLVPVLTTDPSHPPAGLLWARDDQQQVYLRLKNSTVALVNTVAASSSSSSGGSTPTTPTTPSSPGTVSTSVIADRSLAGVKLMLNTVGPDEIKDSGVGNIELASGAVDGRVLGSSLISSTKLDFTSPNTAVTPLTARGIDGQTAPILSVFQNATSRFNIWPASASLGVPLDNSAFSVQDYNVAGKVLLRLRGAGSTGGSLLRAEDPNGLALAELDGSGVLTIAGKFVALGGAETTGALAVNGPLTVTQQANMLGGFAVTGAVQLRSTLQVDQRATFSQGPYLPSGYAAKLGSAAWLRTTTAGDPNRVVVEGVSDTTVGELQLGTGGPVLSGALGTPNVVRINGVPVIAAGGVGANAGLVVGSQLGLDSITGGGAAGVGNIGPSTIQAYNILDASITRPKLSLAAVGSAQIAANAVDSSHIASMYVDRLISGTLNADEIFMGPQGDLYAGPTQHSEIGNARVVFNASGLRAYDGANTELASFTPSAFALRTAGSGTRMEMTAADGLSLYAGALRTARLGSDGSFSLASIDTGGQTRLSSSGGLEFIAAAVRNVAFNPGFEGGTSHQTPQNMYAVDDQMHVYLGEYALKCTCNSANLSSQSFVDLPFGQTVGTTAAVIQHSRDNLAPNPALKTSSTGWSGYNVTGFVGSRQTAAGFYRDYVFSATASVDGSLYVMGPTIPVTQGSMIMFSAQARISRARGLTAQIVFYDASGNPYGSSDADVFNAQPADVNRLGRMCYVPAGIASARLRILASNAQRLDVLEVSCALYDHQNVIDQYADGDTAGWSWTGEGDTAVSYALAAPYNDSVNNLASIYVWSDNPVYVQVAGWDSTANVGRGTSAVFPIVGRRWNRVYVSTSGTCDKLRLYSACTDAAMQSRYLAPVWFSGIQVEQSLPGAPVTRPSPLALGSEPGCRWEGTPHASSSLRAADTAVASLSPSFGVAVSGALVGGSVSGSFIFGARIVGTEIYGSRINGNEINGSRIYGVSITGSTIAGNIITGAVVSGSTVNGGTINGTVINSVALNSSDISSGRITGTSIFGSTLQGSRFFVGTDGGARLEIDGRSGMPPRLFLTNSYNVLTFNLDAATGDVSMRGEMRTDDSGERMVFNPGGYANELRFYPNTGNNYARMYARTFTANSVDYGGLLLNGPTYNGSVSYVWTLHDQIQMYRGLASGNGVESHSGLNIIETETYLYQRNNNTSTYPRFVTVNNNNASLTHDLYSYMTAGAGKIECYPTFSQMYYSGTTSRFSQVYGYAAVVQSLPANTAILMQTSGCDIYNPSTGAYKAIGASSFVTQSARSTKQNIEPLPFDPVTLIRNAPASMWEYREDGEREFGSRRRKRFGPMADDLPATLRVPARDARRSARTAGVSPDVSIASTDGTAAPLSAEGVDLASQIGVLWAALERIAAHVDYPTEKEAA